MVVFMTRNTFQITSRQYVGDINNMNMFERQVSKYVSYIHNENKFSNVKLAIIMT